jgi:hypothetical protein
MLPSLSAPLLPDFDFHPSRSLLATLDDGVVFSVANPLDLALQSMDLMADVLVVEVQGPSTPATVLWFRFDPTTFAARGVSACRLFSDDGCVAGGGVCGWLIDRKRT